MSYIDRTYVERIISPAYLDNLLAYGSNPAASGSAKLSQYISGACSTVDSYLAPAGYGVPLGSPPDMIKRAVAVFVVYDLATFNNDPNLQRSIKDELSLQLGLLEKIRKGELHLPGNSQSTSDGTAGHLFAAVSGSATYVDFDSLLGSFF